MPLSRSQLTTWRSSFFFHSCLTEVLRIGIPGYIPNETDILRANRESTGIIETHFQMGTLSMRIVDVGQRSERKKWIHHFESATSIIFCTALSEYDDVPLERWSQNHILESLSLFESVVNSRWFLRTSIILLLSIDGFGNKLQQVPLERYFPDYTGGTDLNKAAKYFLWRFMQGNRTRLSIYPHFTVTSDTTITALVVWAVKETILQNVLKDSRIL